MGQASQIAGQYLIVESMSGTPCFTSQAAHILECNERTARELADAGILRVTRTPNGTRVFDREQVEAVASERRQRRARDAEDRGER